MDKDQPIVRPPHNRIKFILLHLGAVLGAGGLSVFTLRSSVPVLILAFAPVLGMIGAQPRDRTTYLISVGVTVVVLGAVFAGVLYLALSNFARGRW